MGWIADHNRIGKEAGRKKKKRKKEKEKNNPRRPKKGS